MFDVAYLILLPYIFRFSKVMIHIDLFIQVFPGNGSLDEKIPEENSDIDRAVLLSLKVLISFFLFFFWRELLPSFEILDFFL